VVQFADGEIFNVVTQGRRSMPSYRFQISVKIAGPSSAPCACSTRVARQTRRRPTEMRAS